MQCIYCKEQVGFLQSYHKECYNKIQQLLQRMKNIADQNTTNAEGKKDVRKELVDLASSDNLYRNYLAHKIWDMTTIRTNETIIYIESGLHISESKNRCKMTQTGHRYEKKPVWGETDIVIGNNLTAVLTDKSIYMLQENSIMYQYYKIVNLGFDEKWGYAYFDVKTSSPYPHRFTIRSYNKKERSKVQAIYMFLGCFT